MTLANWCVLAACLLPVVTIGLAKATAGKSTSTFSRYDNQQPRLWAQQLTGWQQRAHAAQNNGFEALPLFIAAVVLAQQAHAAQGRIDQLAVLFVVLRVLYIGAYLLNLGTLRTLIWMSATGTGIAILLMA